MFLETKSLQLSSSHTNTFLLPFSKYSWTLITILLALVKIQKFFFFLNSLTHTNLFQIILLHFLLNLIFRKAKITDSIFQTFGLFFQQGVYPVGNYWSRKLWILTLSLSFLLIYNLYTSSVLSGIIKSSSSFPSTMNELLESPLDLHFADMPYIRNHFRVHSTNETIKALVSKNKKGKHSLLLSNEVGINLVKEENIAFYCAKMTAYNLLQELLNPHEICQLREVEPFFVDKNSHKILVLQKESQYLEMFKYGIMKAKEYGFDHRELQIYQHRRPVCQSSNAIHYVRFEEVKSIFYLLGIAFYVSLLIFVFENF